MTSLVKVARSIYRERCSKHRSCSVSRKIAREDCSQDDLWKFHARWFVRVAREITCDSRSKDYLWKLLARWLVSVARKMKVSRKMTCENLSEDCLWESLERFFVRIPRKMKVSRNMTCQSRLELRSLIDADFEMLRRLPEVCRPWWWWSVTYQEDRLNRKSSLWLSNSIALQVPWELQSIDVLQAAWKQPLCFGSLRPIGDSVQ